MLVSWCYFTGTQAASLAVMAVLLYTAPVFVMLMSIVFFREKLTGAKLTALVLCLAGCVLVFIAVLLAQIPLPAKKRAAQ